MKRFFLYSLFTLIFLVPFKASALQGAPESFADLADKLGPAVVNISTTQNLKDLIPEQQENPFGELPPGHPLEEFNELFKHFMDPNITNRKATSLGSGFFISADGYIVTNSHVIDKAEEITVTFNNQQKIVEVIGVDKKTDLALLKVKEKLEKPVPFVKFGDSDKSRVGDWVMVIGNPFGLGGTVTAGIISARARDINAGPFDDFIQTDAAINRGNSGGPMFNMSGEVIGINTAIYSPDNGGGNVGIGFAVPSNLANPIIEQLKSGKKVVRGWLGVKIQDLTDEIAESMGLAKDQKGALVSEVVKDSPAQKAGVESGDIITKFDGKEVSAMKKLPRIVAETKIGKEVEIELLRSGKTLKVKTIIAELNDSEEQDSAASGKGGGSDDEKSLILGMNLKPLDKSLRDRLKINESVNGLAVVAVKQNSAAAEKGIKVGDVISEASQSKITTKASLDEVIKKAAEKGRKSVLLLVYRGSDPIFVALPIKEEE